MTNTTVKPDTKAHPEPALPADAAPSPASNRTELLVGVPSRACSTKRCRGLCCNTCGRVVWKLASDPNVRVVARGVALPKRIATECALHYDLRVEGRKHGDRFVVHSVRPVPSERGRRAGVPGRLELRATGGACTTMWCSARCCNLCSGVRWAPKPTLDRITWSGPERLSTAAMDCEGFPDHVVTGTWLGPSTFAITSARKLKTRTRE